MNITSVPAWSALAKAAAKHSALSLAELCNDSARCEALAFGAGGCHFDFARQRVTTEIKDKLLQLAHAADLTAQRAALFAGSTLNMSEDRPVLHTALRGGAPDAPAEVRSAVTDALAQMRSIAREIRNGTRRGYTGKAFTDVVHIGIGGSHLGPELVTSALAGYTTSALRLHYVANIDAQELVHALRGLDPATTLFIVVSKSFGTLETQVNAASARSWLLERTATPAAIAQHFIGVTSNLRAAAEFGLPPENLLPMWDWVGGRFSLWSAVGLPILLSLGERHHADLLAGACTIDRHFLETEPANNIPLLSALFGIWNYNFLGAGSLAILCYDERLALLPDYLQQLEMESNGKSVTQQGEPVATHTMPILWGGTGTKGQHAYHQLLHQGTRAFTADIIMVARDTHGMAQHHHWLLANAIAQGEAMANGYTGPADQPHRTVPGDHPTTTIVLDELSPTCLGALLAAYEHKVFCQGAVWGINSFDQWGVELGKQLAEPIYAQLAQQQSDPATSATQQLIDHLVAAGKCAD